MLPAPTKERRGWLALGRQPLQLGLAASWAGLNSSPLGQSGTAALSGACRKGLVGLLAARSGQLVKKRICLGLRRCRSLSRA